MKNHEKSQKIKIFIFSFYQKDNIRFYMYQALVTSLLASMFLCFWKVSLKHQNTYKKSPRKKNPTILEIFCFIQKKLMAYIKEQTETLK